MIWLPFSSTRFPAALVTGTPWLDQVRRARAELRRDVPVAEQRLEPVVPARLVRQQVGHRGRRRVGLPELHALGVGAERVALGAVHADADVVRDLGVLERVRVGVQLLVFRRPGPEHLGDVDRGVLQLLVGRGHLADVAAGPGVRHPGRRGDGVRRHRVRRGGRRNRRVDHARVGVVAGARRALGVEDRVGPVGERARRVGVLGRVVVVGLVAVGDRHAVPVAVQAGERGQDVVAGVRDERRVVVGQERAVAGEEVQQVRYLLQVGRDVRVIPEVVHVVEHERDHVLDAVAQVARRVGGCRRGLRGVRRGAGRGHRGPRQAQRAEQRRRAGGRGDAEPGRLAACASERVPSSPHELFLSRVRARAAKPAPRESPRCHALSTLRRDFEVSFCVNLVKLWSLFLFERPNRA